jgi:hypothetical protein
MKRVKLKNDIVIFMIFVLYSLILLINSNSSNALSCSYSNSPQLGIAYNHVLYEGNNYYYKSSVTGFFNSTYFSFAKINSSIENFYIIPETGEINFTPKDDDVGQHKLLVAVVNEENCFDAKIINLKVYDKPKINEFTPKKESVVTDETKSVLFSASVEDKDNTTIEYKWHLDGIIVSKNNSFVFYPNFNSSGKYNITLEVRNSFNLYDSKTWILNVKEINRAPILGHNIPDIVLLENSAFSPFFLNDYFFDPDGDELTYTYNPLAFSEAISKSDAGIDIIIDNTSKARIIPRKDWYGSRNVYFYAIDPLNNSTRSNMVNIRIIEELKQTVEFEGSDCIVKNCTDWSSCFITNISIRECFVYDVCKNKTESRNIFQTETCYFNASCFDELKNGDEIGVDCGSTCQSCPNCSDGIKNQGEFDIDCGGPCKPCPDCFNKIKDEKETDVDCGGLFCKKCDTYKTCLVDLDCRDYKCINSSCAKSTCVDRLKNGDETGVDCGGSCPLCPACNDKIKNGDETGVDCGGKKCKACPSCYDGIRNNGEILPDCFGPCERCNYFNLIKNNLLLAALFFIMLFGLFLLFVNKTNNIHMLIKLNKIFIFFRFRRDLNVDTASISNETIRKLESLQLRLHKEDISSLTASYFDILQWYYSTLFDLPESFISESLYHEIKHSSLGYLSKIILIKYHHKSVTVHHDALKFEIVFNNVIEEAKFLVKGMKNAY